MPAAAAVVAHTAATLEVTRLLAVLRDRADARTEFAQLSTVCGWGWVDASALEVTDTTVIDAADAAAARRFNATIRPVLWARGDLDRIEAFAGPALVPCGHPLLALDETNRVQFAGTYRLGGPSTTATAAVAMARVVTSPSTDWLVRVQFPGVAPHAGAISALLAHAGLHTVSSTEDRGTHWHRTAAAPRACVDRAIAELRTRHRIRLTAIRVL
jgi:hypothetical protein